MYAWSIRPESGCWLVQAKRAIIVGPQSGMGPRGSWRGLGDPWWEFSAFFEKLVISNLVEDVKFNVNRAPPPMIVLPLAQTQGSI